MKKARRHLWFYALPVILLVLLAGVYFAGRSGSDPNQYGNDFNVYYFAAREIISGRTPYENSLGEWTPYLYPPLLAELLTPLALLPLPVSAYIWFLLSAASLLLALRMSSRLAVQAEAFDQERPPQLSKPFPAHNDLRREMFIACLTLALLLRITLDNFDYGQVNLVVAALAVAHVYFYSRGRQRVAAVALAFAVAIKLTPAVLLFYHLAKRRWKFALANAALIAVVLAASFAPFGSQADDALRTFFTRTIRNEQQFDLAYHGNQSLRAVVERHAGGTGTTSTSSLLTFAVGCLFLAGALAVAWKTRAEAAAVAPFFCLMVLLSPLSWKQHFVVLMLPAAYLAGEAIRANRRRTRHLLYATFAIVFALFNLTSPRLIGVAAAEWCDAHSFVFAGAMILFFAAIWRAADRSDW